MASGDAGAGLAVGIDLGETYAMASGEEGGDTGSSYDTTLGETYSCVGYWKEARGIALGAPLLVRAPGASTGRVSYR